VIFILVVAAFCLGLFIGYNVPHQLKLLAPPKKVEPPAEENLADLAKKLSEEYKK
jgi:hypothetical protein